MLYFSANPNGEAEVVNIQLKPHSKLKKLQFDQDFADIAIKGRGSMGNIVTKYPVKKIILKSKGVSTLAGRKIWYDDVLKRLNADARGKYLGEFDGDDRILTIMSNGVYELTSFDLSNHFDDKMIRIEKYDPEKVYSVVHYDGKSKNYFIKRFVFEAAALGKQTSIISDESGSKLIFISGAAQPVIKLDVLKGKTQIPETTEVNLAEAIDVKGMKAQGNRLSPHDVQEVELLTIEEDEPAEDEEVADKAVDAQVEADTDVDAEDPAPETTQADAAPTPAREEPEAKPIHKVDFEITNPDDVEIDDKGQFGLF